MTIKPRRFDLSPDNFLAGIGTDMKADELGLYWLLCLKIYSAGGPVPYDEKAFATVLNRTDLRVIRRASERLQHLGKISVSGGYVMAKGCATPLQDAANRLASAIENGRKGGRPPNNNKGIDKPGGFPGEKLLPPPHPQPPPPVIGSEPQGGSSKPRRERKVQTTLPDDFPLQADRDAALGYWREKGREDLCARLGDEVEAFRDYHRGKGTRMADWSAAWRTWRGNALKFNAPPKGQIRVIPGTFEQTDDRGWRERMRVWREKSSWIPKWGPRPGEAGCKCPAHIQTEGGGDLLGKMTA